MQKPAIVEQPPVRGVRRPYQTPRLQCLGSVRELTLGAAGSAGEAVGMMAM